MIYTLQIGIYKVILLAGMIKGNQTVGPAMNHFPLRIIFSSILNTYSQTSSPIGILSDKNFYLSPGNKLL